MFFQLLQGTHLEGENVYKAEVKLDEKTGERKIISQPIVMANRDLVSAFGPEKFRRLSDDEADLLLKRAGITVAGKQSLNDSAPATAAKEETEVEKAVKEGAVGIAEPPGNDVTNKFPELNEWPTINVYYKRGKGFFVTENSNIITEIPLKRDEVHSWVKAYMEG